MDAAVEIVVASVRTVGAAAADVAVTIVGDVAVEPMHWLPPFSLSFLHCSF